MFLAEKPRTSFLQPTVNSVHILHVVLHNSRYTHGNDHSLSIAVPTKTRFKHSYSSPPQVSLHQPAAQAEHRYNAGIRQIDRQTDPHKHRYRADIRQADRHKQAQGTTLFYHKRLYSVAVSPLPYIHSFTH